MLPERAPIEVTQFTRKPVLGAFSIERVDQSIRAALPPSLRVRVVENLHASHGVLPRLRDSLRARRLAGEVNHVTGDAHYLTYFLPRARTVLTIHDTVFIERERGFKRFLLWLLWLWLPEKRCARIVAISEETKRRILALLDCPSSKISVIPNPLPSEFCPGRASRTDGPFRLLHIGTKPNKNLERVIEAVAGLDLNFTIIGRLNEDQRQRLVAHGVRHENLVGISDEEMRACYERADALVFVSTDEGFGLPIIEAQAARCPVVTSARAPMDEVAGTGALLVDPEDVGAIRSAIERLMTSATLRADLVVRGEANLRRFRPEMAARLYAELFQDLARAPQ